MERLNKIIRAALLGVATVLFGFQAQAQKFQLPEGPKEEGEIRILCIGNSFTYVHDTDLLLKDISASQGIKLQIGKYLQGGRTFGDHLNIGKSMDAVNFGGYDFAFLQDQSAAPARYSRDKDKSVLDNFKALRDSVLRASPGCRVILERTWSYSGNGQAGGFGTADNLDLHLGKGARKMARKARTWLSPIGDAFNLVRREYPGISLLRKDEHHQSLEGAYLKACVNYLMISGKPFSGAVAVCSLDPEVARTLQEAAMRTVLDSKGHPRKKYRRL